MKSGKPIDISKASLVSLKTELIRKKEEADKLKGSEKYVKLPPKPKPVVKSNPGVSGRNERDVSELSTEEIDLLQKSKDVLKIKSTLYDQLQSGALVSEDGKSRYLVDFESKEKDSTVPSGSEQREQSDPLEEPVDIESVGSDEDFGDDSDWVEYKDCLGRSRRCLRSDLAEMKERDKDLSTSVIKEPDKTEEASEEVTTELVSDDMHLEELRKKWEEKEKELLEKRNVHYEDILFDENVQNAIQDNYKQELLLENNGYPLNCR